MGTDISGWVEAKFLYGETKEWQPVVDLFWLYDTRDYDAFGCFFGIRNYAHFRPIAEGRGLPQDVSEQVRQEAEKQGDAAFGHTWMDWNDIKQIDWEERSEHVDERVHRYVRNEQGELSFRSKASWEKEFAERVGYGQCIKDQEQEWDLGNVVYRHEYMRRKDVKGSWEVVFNVLEQLASRFGDKRVRLVVWFDS
jgi:hypothetical protein